VSAAKSKPQGRRDEVRKPPLAALTFVLALTAVVYLPVLQNGFVNWDDDQYVYKNADLRTGSFASLFLEHDPAGGWHLPNVMGNYHPLTMVSLKIDLLLSREETDRPAGETPLSARVFHLTNLLLHLGTTALVFFFIWILPAKADGDDRDARARIAFLTALFFGVSTLHVESVAWISERKDVLYALFFVLALVFYVRHARTGGRRFYAGALGAFLLSLLAKGQAVTLAPTLFLVDWLMGRPPARRTLLEKAPFLALALVFGLLAVKAQADDGNVMARDAIHPWTLRPFFAAFGLVQYVAKLAVPTGLLVHYPYTLALRAGFWLYAFYLPAALAFVALTVYGLWRRSRAGFGLAFFLMNVAPVLQLLPVGSAVMADRYSYVPSIGLFFAAAVGLDFAMRLYPRHARTLRAAIAIHVLALGLATASRAAVWRDSLTLWTHEAARNPDFAVAYNNIATYYFHHDQLDEALKNVERSIALDPLQYRAYRNRAMIHDVRGREDLARLDYDRTLELHPREPLVLNNRGRIRQNAGDLRGALEDYDKAIALGYAHAFTYVNRAEAHAALGNARAAIADYTEAIARDPSRPDAYSERGALRAESGDLRGAAEDFSAVVERMPHEPFAFLNRAQARLALGDCAGTLADIRSAGERGVTPAPPLAQALRSRCSVVR
jgi:tetratricopeptide (TPR) repeat protein